LPFAKLIYDAEGNIVRPPTRREAPGQTGHSSGGALELQPGQTRKEVEGVFVVRDGEPYSFPFKIGIAGDKYFEVLSGLRPGDEGDYRPVQLGAQHGRWRSGQAGSEAGQRGQVNKFFESAFVAIDAIWSAKLRSFMTVLGNIVAVTSIIAVVSLISRVERVRSHRRFSTRRAPTRSTSSNFRSHVPTRNSTRSAAILG
jgi:hypothetical protein